MTPKHLFFTWFSLKALLKGCYKHRYFHTFSTKAVQRICILEHPPCYLPFAKSSFSIWHIACCWNLKIVCFQLIYQLIFQLIDCSATWHLIYQWIISRRNSWLSVDRTSTQVCDPSIPSPRLTAYHGLRGQSTRSNGYIEGGIYSPFAPFPVCCNWFHQEEAGDSFRYIGRYWDIKCYS